MRRSPKAKPELPRSKFNLPKARGLRSIWVLGGSGGCMWEGQRAWPAARPGRVCHGLSTGGPGGLDWRRGLEGRSRGTCSRGQLKFLKDDLVLENSARSCRRVADPGALAVWGGEWVPPNRAVATAAKTQDSEAAASLGYPRPVTFNFRKRCGRRC
jgi:hypothetical protein